MARTLSLVGAALFLSSLPAFAGQPMMTVDPLFASFDPLEVGFQSDATWITVTNEPGGSELSYEVHLTDGDTADFVLSCPEFEPSCLDRNLGAGQYQTFYITFAPLSSGQKSATVTVMGNDPVNGEDEIQLTGFAFETIFRNGFEPLDPDWSDCVGGSCTSS